MVEQTKSRINALLSAASASWAFLRRNWRHLRSGRRHEHAEIQSTVPADRLVFSIGATTVDIWSLSPGLDREFTRLFESAYGISSSDPKDFDSAAIALLTSSATDTRTQDKYFENFTALWGEYARSGRWDLASLVWQRSLEPVREVERRIGPVHKGTAYYFWGGTRLLAGDVESGYLLVHQALDEDVRTHAAINPSTPAYSLVVMDATKVQQYFRGWVDDHARFTETYLDRYRHETGSSLDFRGLESKLLRDASLRDVVFLFSFSIARLRKLLSSQVRLDGAFAAQFAAGVVFDLCLVVDRAIHHKHGPPRIMFFGLAAHLATAAGIPLSQNDLGALNGMFQNAFDSTLRAALDGTLTLGGHASVTGKAAALAITYGCRNRGAHWVDMPPLMIERLDDIAAACLSTLFLVVDTLY